PMTTTTVGSPEPAHVPGSAQPGATSPREMRPVAVASAIGTGFELYVFLIFGLAAALVFPQLFFPESDPLVGSLLSFMTFGAGFLSRPLGGIVFGHFGDRFSRKTMLVISLVATGACTVAMGLLPTYATDRKSTRLNSSHVSISYAVFCLK